MPSSETGCSLAVSLRMGRTVGAMAAGFVLGLAADHLLGIRKSINIHEPLQLASYASPSRQMYFDLGANDGQSIEHFLDSTTMGQGDNVMGARNDSFTANQRPGPWHVITIEPNERWVPNVLVWCSCLKCLHPMPSNHS